MKPADMTEAMRAEIKQLMREVLDEREAEMEAARDERVAECMAVSQRHFETSKMIQAHHERKARE